MCIRDRIITFTIILIITNVKNKKINKKIFHIVITKTVVAQQTTQTQTQTQTITVNYTTIINIRYKE